MPDVLARVYRGSGVEAIHYGSIAVVNRAGELTHHLGDPEDVFYTRSSIKPFQVLPLIHTGGFDHYGYSQRQLAIMCGSHNGSDDHRQVVMSNLTQAGNTPRMLQCGVHWPIGMELTRHYPTAGEDQDPVRHNCSGKHSGFLALARFLMDEPSEYLTPGSRSQQLVKKAVADMCDHAPDKMEPAIDGCSAPNYAMPLRCLAIGFMRLAGGLAPDGNTDRAVARVRDAIMAYPEMVSGENRLDLDLMRSFPGNIVCKVGAEAIEGIGFMDPPIGIGVKIHDGNWRARGPVFVELFRQLGLIRTPEKHSLLKRHEREEVRNTSGLLTGYVQAEFALKEVSK